jgi:hypothetical protein
MRVADDDDESAVENRVTASSVDGVVQAYKISGDVNINYGAFDEVVVAGYSQIRSEIIVQRDEIVALYEQRLAEVRSYVDDLKRRLCWTEGQLTVALAALVELSRSADSGFRRELKLMKVTDPAHVESVLARVDEEWDGSRHRVLEWHQEGEVFENGDAVCTIRCIMKAVGGGVSYYAQWRGGGSSSTLVEVYFGGVWIDGEAVDYVAHRVHVGRLVTVLLEFPTPIPCDSVFVMKIRYVWPGRDRNLMNGSEEPYSVTLGGDGVNFSYRLKLPDGRNWLWRPLESNSEGENLNVEINWERREGAALYMRGRARGEPRKIGFWLHDAGGSAALAK